MKNSSPDNKTLLVRELGLQAYQPIWQDMQTFTNHRSDEALDEIWLLEHLAVFTQGQAGKPEHILNPQNIPVITIDRGGQVTYHGPGQLMLYTLINLRRLNIGIRQLVRLLEQVVIDLLATLNIKARGKIDAPGVYVENRKICSIGLRVRRGCSYHGLAFNINMDLTPFSYINPCGFRGLEMTQIADFHPDIEMRFIKDKLIHHFKANFGYTQHSLTTALPTPEPELL